jgi:hypothetical protein
LNPTFRASFERANGPQWRVSCVASNYMLRRGLMRHIRDGIFLRYQNVVQHRRTQHR